MVKPALGQILSLVHYVDSISIHLQEVVASAHFTYPKSFIARLHDFALSALELLLEQGEDCWPEVKSLGWFKYF